MLLHSELSDLRNLHYSKLISRILRRKNMKEIIITHGISKALFLHLIIYYRVGYIVLEIFRYRYNYLVSLSVSNNYLHKHICIRVTYTYIYQYFSSLSINTYRLIFLLTRYNFPKCMNLIMKDYEG